MTWSSASWLPRPLFHFSAVFLCCQPWPFAWWWEASLAGNFGESSSLRSDSDLLPAAAHCLWYGFVRFADAYSNIAVGRKLALHLDEDPGVGASCRFAHPDGELLACIRQELPNGAGLVLGINDCQPLSGLDVPRPRLPRLASPVER